VSATELTPHGWGDAPDLYGPRHDYRESLMMRRLRGLLPAGHVLNAGCGAGSFTLRLLDAGYGATSVDASEAFVERVRGLVAARGLAHAAPVELADLHALQFEAEAFDGIVCGEVLEHLDDDRTAVRELARVLRPGGVLVASVPANPWRYDWSDHWAGHRRRYTSEGLAERLTAAGFTDVDVTDYGFPLLGLYHRQVYRRLLKRRLVADNGDLGAPTGAMKLVSPLVRAAFELDTLFLGRRPGYFGLIASARRPLPA
jgi:SAM-dependent methyltransferase